MSHSTYPPRRSRATRWTSATFDASVTRENMLSPKNTAPTAKTTVNAPNAGNGYVGGKVAGTDADKDLLTYSVNPTTAKGGTVVATTVANMASSDVKLNLSMLTLLQKRLQGTIFGGGNPHHDIPSLLAMYKAGCLNLDDMVTRQYKLEQINDGYRDMLEGRNIRGVIRYTDADR